MVIKLCKKVLKENVNLFADPKSFKFSNITPALKQGSKNLKDNCRPKKLMSKQLLNYFDNTFSKFQCSFRKEFGTQHCLLLMIHKWKKAVDSSKAFGAILADLSKAFN